MRIARFRNADRRWPSGSFVVLAPASEISQGKLTAQLDKASIRHGTIERAKRFGTELDDWFHQWFEPCLEVAIIAPLSGEDVLSEIGSKSADAHFLLDFYAPCLELNARPSR